MMLLKYEELDTEAQARAREEYLLGWNETHPDDYIPDTDLHNVLLTEGGVYDEDGEYICQEEELTKDGDPYADSEWAGGVDNE